MEVRDTQEQLMVRNASLAGSRFDDVDLSDAVFRNVRLDRAAFADISLADATLTNANLSGLVIRESDLSGMTINGIAVTELLAAYQDKPDLPRV